MNVTYLSKDNNWQNENTTYWFDVDGETYGVSDTSGDRIIVDSESCPVNTSDARDAHLLGLLALVTAEIEAA